MHFIDLKSQQALIREKIDTAIANVLNHGQYVMGPEITLLEEKLASFTQAKHCVSCSSGTDALLMALLAIEIKTNDVIFVPSFTFPATAEVITLLGATPYFVDIKPNTFNLCSESLNAAISEAKNKNLNIRAVIAVDMFGLPADYHSLMEICQQNDLTLIADAAQSLGASYKQQAVGTLAHITTTSFFPAKPLGCYGDGGAVFTNDSLIANKLISIRNHGQGTEKYDIQRIGINGRLDTIQAAVLLEKLKIFPDEILQRNKIANNYNKLLSDYVTTPKIKSEATSVWAQYTLQSNFRNQIVESLKTNGIPVQIYYPKPMHVQPPYKNFPCVSTGLKTTEQICKTVFSLPMHPYLTKLEQTKVTEQLIATVLKTQEQLA